MNKRVWSARGGSRGRQGGGTAPKAGSGRRTLATRTQTRGPPGTRPGGPRVRSRSGRVNQRQDRRDPPVRPPLQIPGRGLCLLRCREQVAAVALQHVQPVVHVGRVLRQVRTHPERPAEKRRRQFRDQLLPRIARIRRRAAEAAVQPRRVPGPVRQLVQRRRQILRPALETRRVRKMDPVTLVVVVRVTRPLKPPICPGKGASTAIMAEGHSDHSAEVLFTQSGPFSGRFACRHSPR